MSRQDPRPLVAVLGPTASGKSALSLHLARHFHGEIVNCDSLQVYRGLDIGTAKPSAAERASAPHHLIDILDPAKVFNAGEFARQAAAVIEEIDARRRLPILAGGTGFYVRSLLEGLNEGPGRNDALRARLLAREQRRPGSLHRLLTRLDAGAAVRIHPNDVNKGIRALEIRLLAGVPSTELFREARGGLRGFTALKLVLDPDRAELRERIALRTRRMFEAGLLDEVAALLENGAPATAKAFESIGYRQAVAVIQGAMPQVRAVEATTLATAQYAKRQLTWFRREKDAVWLRGFGEDPGVAEQAITLVTAHLDSLASESLHNSG